MQNRVQSRVCNEKQLREEQLQGLALQSEASDVIQDFDSHPER